nr:immunoglobulin heavy chain junction region [Mus musculus]MBK4187674.1 immunoglobulin heavy chain junction region [Mus musculus]
CARGGKFYYGSSHLYYGMDFW